MEEINGIDYVECPYCGKKTKQITEAHLKTHGKTFKLFREEYPNMIFRSEKLSKICIENQIKVQYSNERNLCKCCGNPIKWNQAFCSVKCAAEFKKTPIISVNCEYCGEAFYTKITSKARFCSRQCASKVCKNKKLTNKNNYRDKIRNKYGNQCAICNSFESLRVHHLDENHRNNTEENLILLCESCHRKIHSGPKITIYKKIELDMNYDLSYTIDKKIILELAIGKRVDFNNFTNIDFDEISIILKNLVVEKINTNQNLQVENMVFYLFVMLRKLNINVVVIRILTENNIVEYKDEGGVINVLRD